MSSDVEDEREVAFAVTGGGEPSAEELAAITIALTPVAGDDEADDGTQASGWRRAALVEGVGGRNAASLPDLVSGRMGLGHVGDPHADL